MWPSILIHVGRYLGLPIFNYILTRSLEHSIKRWLGTHPSAAIYDVDAFNPIPDIYGEDVLKALLLERRFSFNEIVSIFGTEAKLSSLLGGQEELTSDQIQKLSDYFCVSPLIFFPREQ